MNIAQGPWCVKGREYALALLLEGLAAAPPTSDALARSRERRASIVHSLGDCSLEEYAAFAREIVHIASGASGIDDPHVKAALYRVFDPLDEILRLDFSGDAAMGPVFQGQENIYPGSGRGVQTSYLTILEILKNLRLPQGAHLIDLGSGFGRVGLTAGLWRRDLQFTGYEFVGHRVAESTAAANLVGIGSRVRFHQQDLSEPGFQIPAAQVYYLYDPFCLETYAKVLSQLVSRGERGGIIVVTKGDAALRFQERAPAAVWGVPEKYDYGNIQIFRSKAA